MELKSKSPFELDNISLECTRLKRLIKLMEKLTPMMAQYKSIKAKYPDCILMYRLGDFYEMFFEDAKTASIILQITLTARGKGASGTVPMCGIPYHALEQYLPKLTKAGKKVAICDQITAPDGKGIVERDVIRVITPGTTLSDNVLDSKSNNYVCAVAFINNNFGLAIADVTTGDFTVSEFNNKNDFLSEIYKSSPAECIGDANLLNSLMLKDIFSFPYAYTKNAYTELTNHFEVKTLDIFELEDKKVAIESAGILLEYLKETQKTNVKHIKKIQHKNSSEFMHLDESCIRNLELFFANRGQSREGSLVWAIDKTITPMGGRRLKNWLLNPLIDAEKINSRLSIVDAFYKDSTLQRNVKEQLTQIYDIERLLSRVSLGTGNARDLLALRESFKKIPAIKTLLSLSIFDDLKTNLHTLEELVELLDNAISDQPPLVVRDGGMIKLGYNSELDELLNISKEGKGFITQLQEREIKRSGISSLKVRYNKVFGYYIEISNSNLSSVPEDYIRKQTLVNAERYITPELKEYEEKVLNAEDKIKELEYKLFYELVIKTLNHIKEIQSTAYAISLIDVYCSFAYLATAQNYVKPEINNSNDACILDGRHPVIESISRQMSFVPNDFEMNNHNNFILITGPNMGGKSTYLRQTALIFLLAQIGSFVPAKSAKIGVVDRIFTRVGASDNLVKGDSTFMVEMQEAANILHNATNKSLIILDEIGRGTSTYDGVSIAWSIMEYIHDRLSARTIFATHYHELIELADKLPCASNMSVAVKENAEEGVVFLYKIMAGGVDKSYGIEVGKLAGLPIEVVSRARGVLKELESKHIGKASINQDQLQFFDDTESRKHKAIIDELKNVDIDNLTPMQAFEKLNEIKKKT